MNMRRADKKRIREEQELSRPDDSCGQRKPRLMEFEAGTTFQKPEITGAGNQNLPQYCSLSNENSILVKDPWSWEDGAGFGIRSIAAIRKQSYLLDYLQDSAQDNSSREKEVTEQQKLQVEEEEDLRKSLFEATDDQLWRPQSPLPNTEALFSLDSVGSHDCTTLLQDESVVQSAASCFRIWEQDDDHKNEKNHADGISFVYDSGVSDWLWRVPLDESQFSESVEFESSMPSL